MRNSEAEQLRTINHHRIGATLPNEKWIWYQEWNNAIFLHWRADAAMLKNMVPASVQLDTFNGEAWVSLVAFTMQHICPRQLPHLSFISNFHEINLRTYVTDGEHHGVYFLSIEAGKLLSAYLSRTLSGLPYQKARMSREYGKHYSYNSINPRTGNFLDIDFSIGDKLSAKTELDTWLTERYYLYMDKGSSVSIFPVHHPEWELKNIDIHQLDLSYRIGETELSQRNVELMHYSPGVKVIAWPDKKI